MNKAELIDAVAARVGDRRAAATAVEAVLATVQRTVHSGERVALSGFGVFERVERAARTARNPSTGEAVRLEATSVPRFRPGQAFKDMISGTIDPPPQPEAVQVVARRAPRAAGATSAAATAAEQDASADATAADAAEAAAPPETPTETPTGTPAAQAPAARPARAPRRRATAVTAGVPVVGAADQAPEVEPQAGGTTLVQAPAQPEEPEPKGKAKAKAKAEPAKKDAKDAKSKKDKDSKKSKKK